MKEDGVDKPQFIIGHFLNPADQVWTQILGHRGGGRHTAL
jgi:hypothetical protein